MSIKSQAARLGTQTRLAAPDSPLLQDRRHRRRPAREVQRLVQVHRQVAGLDIRATPHTFRHSLASYLATRVSLRIVQQLLGHRFLASTEVYLHNQPEDMVQAVALCRYFEQLARTGDAMNKLDVLRYMAN